MVGCSHGTLGSLAEVTPGDREKSVAGGQTEDRLAQVTEQRRVFAEECVGDGTSAGDLFGAERPKFVRLL